LINTSIATMPMNGKGSTGDPMKALVTITALTLTATSAFADGARNPGVNARQHHQHARVQQGVRSGELTRPEAHRAREGQRDIRQLERAYKSDGTLTRAERTDLHREQSQASRQIRRQKHDQQERN
jgi:Skp family chaperone for outer membrane proteins